MTDTFMSSHIDETLYFLVWEGLSAAADQWSVLFRLLPALAEQSWVFGRIGGTIRVARGSLETPTFEEWPINTVTDAAALRTHVDSLGELPRPLELPFRCEPLLWLPDDHVNVLDFDDSEFFSLGRATMSKVDGGTFSVPGLQSWRVHDGPVPLLSLEVTFLTPHSAGLEVCSNCDLWRSKRLDGEPNPPHGEANARMLARSIDEIAAATGARIGQQP